MTAPAPAAATRGSYFSYLNPLSYGKKQTTTTATPASPTPVASAAKPADTVNLSQEAEAQKAVQQADEAVSQASKGFYKNYIKPIFTSIQNKMQQVGDYFKLFTLRSPESLQKALNKSVLKSRLYNEQMGKLALSFSDETDPVVQKLLTKEIKQLQAKASRNAVFADKIAQKYVNNFKSPPVLSEAAKSTVEKDQTLTEALKQFPEELTNKAKDLATGVKTASKKAEDELYKTAVDLLKKKV